MGRRSRLEDAGGGPRWTLFLCLFTGQAALLTLSPILPAVARDFGVTTATAGQLRTASGVVAGLGALGLVLGRRRWSLRSMLLGGVAAVTLGSFVSGVAPTFAVLVAAQVVIGGGLALLLSAGLAAAGEWAAPGERGRVLSWTLSGQPAAWIVGMPVVGLAAALTWRLGWLVLPFASGLVALWAVWRRERDVRDEVPGLDWARPGVVGWAAGELLAYSAWAGTLVYAGALFIEVHGLSVARTGVALAVMAAAYVPGTFAARRWVDAAARPLLVVLALAAAVGVLGFGVVRSSPWITLGILSATAFLAGARTIAGSACGLDVFPEDKVSVMALRTTSVQLGYFVGAAAGGAALGTGGYGRMGVVFAILFAGGAVPHLFRMARSRAGVRRPEGDLEAVVSSATDAIVTADDAGRILSWNGAAERIFGHSAEEAVGEPLTILMPERFSEAHRAGHARVAAGGEARVIGSTVELAGLRSDGTEFPIELSLSTWTRDGRRFFAGIIRDVSERARLTRELTDSRERLDAILASATDAIVCADAEGRVVLWNPAAERLLGHREADILGEPLTTIVPERFREAHEEGIRRVSSGGEQRIIGGTVEVAALRADGGEFPVELSLSTWTTSEGRFYGGIIRDVTERKRAEEEVRRANESLAEKNEQLEALSGKLAKYLSRNVYESIFSGRTEVKVTSYRKKLTVFFSDIQGFTELTDSMEAESLSQLLNQYLSEMSVIAARYGGTVDKFIGDGIMIFFGDPETRGEGEDALACVEMGLEMRDRVHELQDEWRDRGVPRTLHVRMGINTGYVTVGNFGSEDRLDYTIVGGQVNAASRLESSAEPDQILVSYETYSLVKDRILCEPVGEIKVKGIAYPIRTYRVLGPHDAYPEGLRPIHVDREGFRLSLDARVLGPGDAAAAREALRGALTVLEEVSSVDYTPLDGEPPPTRRPAGSDAGPP